MPPWKMDRWKFYSLIHRHHTVWNPTSVEKLDMIVGLAGLRDGSRVVDLGSGPGEVLFRIARRWGIVGTGVDLSPLCIEQADRTRQEQFPRSRIEFVHMEGQRYRPAAGEHVDLAICLGASWIFRGFLGTIRSLRAMAAPGGCVMIGEPYWIRPPPAEYLAAEELQEDAVSTHAGNVAMAEKEGLSLLYAAVSPPEDWDRYEGLQWYAAAEHARDDPDDPDLPEITRRIAAQRESYLRWGRDTFGWAIYLFRC